MTKVYIELDEEQAQRLRELVSAARKSEQAVCREAVEHYLETHQRSEGGPHHDRYAPFRKMIGLVPAGPTDASIAHDVRPGDPP